MIDKDSIKPGDIILLHPRALCDRRVTVVSVDPIGPFVRVQCHNWPSRPEMDLPAAMLEQNQEDRT